MRIHCHCHACVVGAMNEVQGFSLLECYDNTRRTDEFNRISEALAQARFQHALGLRRAEYERDIAKAQLHEANAKLNEAIAELTTAKAKQIKTEPDLKVSKDLNSELGVGTSRYRAYILYGIVLLLIIILVYGRLRGGNLNSPVTMEDILKAQIQKLKENIEATLTSEKQSLAANAQTTLRSEMQNLKLDLENTLRGQLKTFKIELETILSSKIQSLNKDVQNTMKWEFFNHLV